MVSVMSSEQSLDPQVIEQTKQQIRGLVNEIAQLARSELSPQQFYGEFLTRVVSALAAVGGAVWAADEEGRMGLQYQINLGETRLREDEEAQKRHSRMLQKVLRSGEGGLMPPRSGGGEDDEAGNPTDFLVVLGPLKTELAVAGVVEIFQRPDTGLSAQKGYLRFVLQMCDLAGDFLKSHQLRHFSDRQQLWTQLEEFTRSIHASLNPRITAYTIANEGRRLIDCDRVSVAVRKGGRCAIEAISGQDMIDKRSNTVRMLARVATEVVNAGEPIWYTGDTSNYAPQVEEAIQDYVDETHTKTLAILPLKRPRPQNEDDTDHRFRQDEAAFGALIVEQIEDSRVPDIMVQRTNVVAQHSTTALSNAIEHDSVFLMPVWKLVGKSKILVSARHLPKTVSISIAVVAALLAMIFVPYRFDLHAKGSLEPIERRDVFARIDGVVNELRVKHGDVVKEGQVLAILRNKELDQQIIEISGNRTATFSRINATEHSRLGNESRMSPDERMRIDGDLAELRTKLASYDSQLKLLREKEKDLVVVSPGPGRIVTWDLHNRLIQRPVQRGQVLMRVADPNGPWQLELRMAEDRMGHITRAMQKAEKQSDPDKQKLEVSYILATEPGTTRYGKVREVEGTAQVRDEEGSSVLIKVDVRKEDLPPGLRPGTQVTGKVHCGYRAIGYVWFHDVFAFFNSRVLFKL
jgi:biotin carboxyl carrier protein